MELESQLFKQLYDKNIIYSFFINELRLKGYKNKELLFLKESNDILDSILDNTLINGLKDLVNTRTSKRFKKLMLGKNLIYDLVNHPNCYKFVVIDDEENGNLKDIILFITKDRKKAYFKHEDECQKGLTYIDENIGWQNIEY